MSAVTLDADRVPTAAEQPGPSLWQLSRVELRKSADTRAGHWLLLVVALFGPSIPVITAVIAIAQWPEVARLTRSLVLVEREKPYVAAATVLGLRRSAVLVRHVIPNVVAQATLVVLLLLAQAVLLESALSYLGAGPERPFATWGRIISDGQNYILSAWWLATFPGLAIVFVGIAFSLIGDGLADLLRPGDR